MADTHLNLASAMAGIREHGFFPILFNLVIFSLFFYFGIPSAYPAFLLSFFLPGYALSCVLFPGFDEMEATILSLPVSFAFVGTIAYLFSLAGLPVVSWGFLLLLNISLISLWINAKKGGACTPKTRADAPTIFLALLAVILAFYASANIFANADLTSDYPSTVRSSDSSWHVNEIDWVAQNSKFSTLPPYLAHGLDGVLDFNPPIPYLFPAFLSKLGMLHPWNALGLFNALIFTFIALVGFAFYRELYGERVGMLAVYAAAMPIGFAWFHPGIVGSFRTPVELFLASSLFYSVFYMIDNRKNSAWLLGLMLAGLSLSHPSGLMLAAPAGIFIAYFAFRTKDMRPMRNLLFSGAFLFAALPYIPLFLNGFLSTRVSGGLGSLLFSSFSTPDKLVGTLTDPNGMNIELLTIDTIGLAPLALAFAGMLLPFFAIKQNDGTNLKFKRQFFLLLALFTLFLVSGYWAPFMEHQYKIRFETYFFIYPLMAGGAYHLLQPFFRNKQAAFFAVLLGLLMITHPWTYAPTGEGMLSPESYAPLSWIQNNTPQDSTIFTLGYLQGATVFSHRRAYYLDSGLLFQTLSERSQKGDFSEIWMAQTRDELGMKREGLGVTRLFEIEGLVPKDICMFDYVVIVHYPMFGTYTHTMAERLSRTHTLVYNNAGVTIQKAREKKTGCLAG